MRMKRLCSFIFILMLVWLLTSPTSTALIETGRSNSFPPFNQATHSVESHLTTDLLLFQPFEIVGNVGFVAQGWPGNGTSDSPFLIENLNITTSNSTAIRIVNVTVHFSIIGCLLVALGDNHNPMIELERVSNGLIEDCIVSDANTGILVSSCSRITLSRNTFMNSWFGAFIESGQNVSVYANSFLHSRSVGVILESLTDCEISNNSFSFNECGIGLNGISRTEIAGNEFVNDSTGIGAVVMGSRKLDIHDNRFLNISSVGIYVASIETGYATPDPEDDPPPIYTVLNNNFFSDSEYGFIADIGGPVLFTRNQIERCDVGVLLSDTKGNRIVNNSVVDCLRYGIWLEHAHLNTVYGNTISVSGTRNALDDNSGFNTWDNGIDTGNTWSDYNGTPVYVIDGNSSGIDRWPARCGPPFIWVQDHLEVVQGITGNELLFWAFDSDPLSYEVWQDGVLVNSGPWDGTNLSVSVGLLGLGEYNFTVQVHDTQDGFANAQCTVKVIDPDNSILIASIGVTSIVILSAIIIQRKRAM